MNCEGEGEAGVKCNGALQCAHGFSRRYMAVRYNRLNLFALCAAHHTFWTHRPIEWDAYIRKAWGDNPYEELRELALAGDPPDYAVVLADLSK